MGPNDYLSPHFQAKEFNAQFAPSQYVPNITRTAQWLELTRSILAQGVSDPRIKVTSGWRSPEQNASAGGAINSDHMVGLAADFKPLGQSQWSAWRKLSAARDSGALPSFDQIIFYPLTGHIHVGLGSRMRREFRVRLFEGSGGTPLLTSPDTLSGAPVSGDVQDRKRSGTTTVIVLASLVALGALAFATFRKIS